MSPARAVLMVRPVRFGFNPETAATNHFQQTLAHLTPAQIQAQAFAEFDALAAALRGRGVRVLVFDDTPEPHTPDSIFPNNWLTLHADGRAVLYPMCAPNRRLERRPDVLAALAKQFQVREVLDFSAAEQEGHFLEGTGSVVFNHAHRLAYAALSPRTDAALLAKVCAQLDYRPVAFQALDAQGQAIYHTNVMLSVGPGFAVVCLESIRNAAEQAAVADSLAATGHEIIDISLTQVARFAGNVLALESAAGEPLLALSQHAYDAFAPAQRAQLGRHAALLPVAVPTIETLGGGSVRCMLAEVFLPA